MYISGMFLLLFLLLGFSFPVSAANSAALPYWFIPLREAVYEQLLTADQIAPMYREISARAQTTLRGAEQFVILSRIEYMMGRAFQFEERNNKAAARYEEGMRYAQMALDIQPSAEAWQMRAENLSQLIAARNSNTFAITHGLNVERWAKNALSLDSRNAAAQIMIASRWIYAPSPFNNFRRGITMMMAIPQESNMQKDDEFNVYVAIGYAYIQQRRFSDARPWILKSLEIYPTNKFARSLLEQR